MPKKILPRIVAVAPGERPMTLRVRWDKGTERIIDVSEVIQTFRVYAPLRESPELFRQVHVGEYGTDVVWTDAIDMAADTLWRLAQEQTGQTMTADAFRRWRERKAYTLDEAAQALGLSRRIVAYYEKGDRQIPRIVALATKVASVPARGNSQMAQYEEIKDINEISRLNELLRSRIRSLCYHAEERKINRVTGSNKVYFFNNELWWSYRSYPLAPKTATQDNNLFGYGKRGAPDALTSEIEVNLPIGKARRVQGAFVRGLKTNSTMLAHRGNNVRRGTRSFSLRQSEFRDALAKTGLPLVAVPGKGLPFILIGPVNLLEVNDIAEFVSSIRQAKDACS